MARQVKQLKLTLQQVMNAVRRDDMTGFCAACHAKQAGVEPDARDYPCKRCGEPAVMGAEEFLARIA